MALIYTEVEKSDYKPCPFDTVSGYVQVTVDPKKKNQFPFPHDYKYLPCILPRKYIDWAERYHNFKVRPDDIWVLGFPKSGTTWLQNILHKFMNNLDLSFVPPSFNFFDGAIQFNKIDGDEEFGKYVDSMEKTFYDLDDVPSPRLIKSHLPPFLLPRELWTVKPKMIHISREVKDVAVSLFHMIKKCMPNAKTITAHEHHQMLYNEKSLYFGPYYEHIYGFQQLHHLDHLLFMTYEELSANTFATVKRLSDFLECSYNDEQLNELIENVSFGRMKNGVSLTINNVTYSDFCRKGKVGGYRDEMDVVDIQNFDRWTEKKKKQLNMA